MIKAHDREHITELITAFQKVGKRPTLLKAFLVDILTREEYEDLTLRLQILKLLKKGLPQRDIAKKLGVSIAKITRGSRLLQNKKSGSWWNAVVRARR